LQSLNDLHHFLSQYRKEYIGTRRYILSEKSTFTERDKDELEKKTQQILKKAFDEIDLLSKSLSK
jgi:hypothetical protein